MQRRSHIKVFSIQIFQYFSQIPPRICTLVLFIIYRIAGKFGREFNLAVWRSPTQELRNEILLRNCKSPNLNSANILFQRLEAKSPIIIPANFSGYTVYIISDYCCGRQVKGLVLRQGRWMTIGEKLVYVQGMEANYFAGVWSSLI